MTPVSSAGFRAFHRSASGILRSLAGHPTTHPPHVVIERRSHRSATLERGELAGSGLSHSSRVPGKTRNHEANLSAQSPSSPSCTRLPRAHEDPCRTQHPEASACKGSQAARRNDSLQVAPRCARGHRSLAAIGSASAVARFQTRCEREAIAVPRNRSCMLVAPRARPDSEFRCCAWVSRRANALATQ